MHECYDNEGSKIRVINVIMAKRVSVSLSKEYHDKLSEIAKEKGLEYNGKPNVKVVIEDIIDLYLAFEKVAKKIDDEEKT